MKRHTLLTVVIDDCERDSAFPTWTQSGPLCSEGACPGFDGKRCRLTGFRPDNFCEPAVTRMKDELGLHEAESQMSRPHVPQRAT